MHNEPIVVELKRRNATIYFLPEEFDDVAVAQTRAFFTELPATATNTIVLDFTHVVFLDSTGIGAIVGLHRGLARRGIRLALTGLAVQPASIVDLTRLNMVVEVYPTLKAFEAASATEAGQGELTTAR